MAEAAGNGVGGRQGSDLGSPANLGHWATEKIRFQDIDRLDHVNNVAFAAYAESGRVEFLETVTPTSLQRSNAPFWVIAKLDLQFRAQAYYPGEIRIGTGVLRVGTSSVTLGQGMFAGERCVATTESVVVLLDPATGRGAPLPDHVKEALEAYRIPTVQP